ncbi:DUF4124 domain-containing protein [Pseudomonas sp. JS3066]|jgi:hypothetical protein|uniref:DUF4124 domain-containing protein n=1 Tax=unclassified Pseudomonas TaxID=196821 RepID=UPI000EA9D22D|nr:MULTISPECIES: DUF4124 domain-containing protein [unclassified Pseudomonas]AYF90319.1 DUF4124 domain-containing protein [Pseudomonas sp. DY-1]MDH4652564.1 DUF4124 domain-containing protein [Pseudomonas sp. BN606]MRK20895.1 DUF4124 domain-containing protein [Pseudomonas sp. JG-B]WVK92104.1 DUF4124 domain-containing protein [Pseudomonas sp. JS3066]
MRHLLCCLLLVPAIAGAEIYRWTDAQGQVHFSETPGEGAEPVSVKPQVVERDQATREREARTAKFFDARRQEKAAAADQATEAREKQQRRCGQLRSQQDQLSRGGPFYRVDERGERQYYTDEEIETFHRKLGENISRDCN